MVLKRAGSKGVCVIWPKGWQKRFYRQNFPGSPQTACDRLIGGCSCGRFHSEHDEDTMNWLSDKDAVIESHEEWFAREKAGVNA